MYQFQDYEAEPTFGAACQRLEYNLKISKWCCNIQRYCFRYSFARLMDWFFWKIFLSTFSFGVSGVVGLANFRCRFPRFTFKSYEFSGLEMCHGLRVWPIFVLGCWVHSNPIFSRF